LHKVIVHTELYTERSVWKSSFLQIVTRSN